MKRTLALLGIALFVAGCPGANQAPRVPRNGESARVVTAKKDGPGFRLSNAEAEGPQIKPNAPLAAPTPLSEADTQRLLARMPVLGALPGDVKDWHLPDRTMPAPRPGRTITETFPPPPSAAAAPSIKPGPLTVERRMPEGEVPLAPHLAVTFSQPMVALSTQDELAAQAPPITITPPPKGRWRWVSTQTAMFQPEPRFAMATSYAVEVSKDAKALSGVRIANAERWTFATPPPVVRSTVPADKSKSVSRKPILFVSFDQPVEPATVLKSLAVVGPKESVPVVLATEAEIEGDEVVRASAKHEEAKRWLAFRPARPLEPSTLYRIVLKAGAIGTEGPRPTAKDQSFELQTHGPLAMRKGACGRDACRPGEGITIEFTNAIDPKAFDKKMVRVAPEIPGMKVETHGSYVSVYGATKGRTRYRFAVDKGIADVHGQTLGEDGSFELDVGSAEPALFGAEHDMVVLEPTAPRTYDVYSINEPKLHARLYAVKPDDWNGWLAYLRDYKRETKPPGKLVLDAVVEPKAPADQLASTAIDLAGAMSSGNGHVVLVVESTRPKAKDEYPRDLRVWIQATQLGLDAFVERDRVTGFVTRLADGAAEPNVEVSVLGASSARSDARGLAVLPLSERGGPLLVARKGTDAVLVPSGSWTGGGIRRALHNDDLRWLVFDDRGMYRPGEEVFLKGWVRLSGTKRGGDLALFGAANLTYTVDDPRGAQVAKGRLVLDAHGSFSLSFKVPKEGNLGSVRVGLQLETPRKDLSGTSTSHHVKVAEFRRPEFEVTARASEGPHVVGKHAIATASASYYTGGGLGGAPIEWRVSRSFASFAPPNRAGYTFGVRATPAPLSRIHHSDEDDYDDAPGGAEVHESWTAKTDGGGVHRLRVDFEPLDPPRPMSLRFGASIEDRNRQRWASETRMLVHPASEYVGLKAQRAFLAPGDELAIEIVVTDLDGKAVPGRKVSLEAARIDGEQKGGEWVETEAPFDAREITVGPDGLARLPLKPKEPGRVVVRATIVDPEGRKNQTEMTAWITGALAPRDRTLEAAKIELVADKTEYRPGDEAELLVVSPFAPAEGVLTVRRQGIVRLERFTLKSNADTIKVKLDDDLVPNATLQVDLVGAMARTDAKGKVDASQPKMPAHGSKNVAVRVLPTKRTLTVTTAATPAKLEPGGATRVDVDVKDVDGKPVQNARIAIVVADEAVLALSRKRTPDPIAVFYASRGVDVQDFGMRGAVIQRRDTSSLASSVDRDGDGIPDQVDRCPNEPETFNGIDDEDGCPDRGRVVIESNNIMIRQGAAATVDAPIVVRKNFSALAVFAPEVGTDAKGHAAVPVKLPDNLTRYRIMAVVSAGERSFGATESTITARLPLMVRPSAPRFLSFGDKFDLPVLLQNQTDAPMTVDVAVRATNATLGSPLGQRAVVPANDRVEVRFAAAAAKPGRARFQVGASSSASPGQADASQVELPVYTPATTEAFATYGEIDEGAISQKVAKPTGVLADYGGVEVTTSSTALQALTDAVLYLVQYPYECAEQVASRVLAIAALKDVLAAFQVKDAPAPAAMLASTKTDLERLQRDQSHDGGWGFWAGGQSWPFLSVHVAHALARAQTKGFAVDKAMLGRAHEYLKKIEGQIPAFYGKDERHVIVAYALYVRKLLADPDAARARRLIDEAGGLDKMPLEAVGFVWPTLAGDEAIRRHVQNRVSETASDAHFTTRYADGSYLLLASDRRADGILLEAMIADQPKATLIPKLVKGLLGHRKAGRWSSTQENAFVLLSLARYFEVFEKTTPDFVARVWLGDRFAGEHAFRGRTTERDTIPIPMKVVTQSPKDDLVIAKDGPGRLYYRVGLAYAPSSLTLPPIERGFTVSRRYEPVDAPSDVTKEKDGTWKVKAGARVRVRVTMVAPGRRTHVALVDRMPAGFEPMNPDLAVTGEIPQDPKARSASSWWWQRSWYEHTNVRDDRMEAFASLLWEGVHELSYVARATTPGTYVAPAPKAEEMYTPETFGRGASERVVVFP